VPVQWIDKMKDNWRSLGPFVTAARMVRDYTAQLYEPAAASSSALLEDGASRGKALAHWKRGVIAAWPGVKVVDLDIATGPAHEGDERRVRAQVDLGGLDDGQVTVQALHGPIDSAGSFVGPPDSVTLRPTGNGGFEGAYRVGEAGPYGVAVRVVPCHSDLISPMELGVVAWAV
jgi:starch phosphorylase